MSPGMGGYTTVGGAVRKMWAEEGIRGFYKGLYPNLLKVHILSLCFCGMVLMVGCAEYGCELVKFWVCPRFAFGTLACMGDGSHSNVWTACILGLTKWYRHNYSYTTSVPCLCSSIVCLLRCSGLSLLRVTSVRILRQERTWRMALHRRGSTANKWQFTMPECLLSLTNSRRNLLVIESSRKSTSGLADFQLTLDPASRDLTAVLTALGPYGLDQLCRLFSASNCQSSVVLLFYVIEMVFRVYCWWKLTRNKGSRQIWHHGMYLVLLSNSVVNDQDRKEIRRSSSKKTYIDDCPLVKDRNRYHGRSCSRVSPENGGAVLWVCTGGVQLISGTVTRFFYFICRFNAGKRGSYR